MSKSTIFICFLLAMMAGVVACQKDDLKQDASLNEPFDATWGKGDTVKIQRRFYLKAKIDTVLLAIQDSTLKFGAYVDSVGYGDCMDTNKIVGQIAGIRDSITGHGFEFKILSCMEKSADSLKNKATIQKRTYAYGSSNVFNSLEGVEVKWTDKNGKVWQSLPGTGAQQNFSFQIAEVKDHDTGDTLSDAYVFGRLDLQLYNGIESIRVENGEFFMRIGKF